MPAAPLAHASDFRHLDRSIPPAVARGRGAAGTSVVVSLMLALAAGCATFVAGVSDANAEAFGPR